MRAEGRSERGVSSGLRSRSSGVASSMWLLWPGNRPDRLDHYRSPHSPSGSIAIRSGATCSLNNDAVVRTPRRDRPPGLLAARTCWPTREARAGRRE